MKAISSSIIVFAAAMLIIAGSFNRDGNAQSFLVIAGCILGVIALAGWILSMGDKQK
jgi:hypothetical protein